MMALRVIRLYNVFGSQLLKDLLLLETSAMKIHVDQMPNVLALSAGASLSIKAIHIKDVVQSAQILPNAIVIELVCAANASTHVLAHVVSLMTII